MTKYTIVKNAPPPNTCKSNSYPFRDMKIGDCFDTEAIEELRVRPAASYFSKRNPGFKFSVRRHNGGVRVWRIAPKKD